VGASEWGEPPNALRAKGVEKKKEKEIQTGSHRDRITGTTTGILHNWTAAFHSKPFK
jgi:hypothetical protein